MVDSAYALIAWSHDLQQHRPITVVTRLWLDAALYEAVPEREAGQLGRPRLKDRRSPTLAARLADPNIL